MKYPDVFLISEAWTKAERFEGEVQRQQLLALAPKALTWRYRLANLLLQSAVRLEPKLNPTPVHIAKRAPC